MKVSILGNKAKYGNTRSLCALGHSHASKLEASVCQLIQHREKAKEIKLLQIQDHVYLTEAHIGYVPDFRCQDLVSGDIFWIEAKGFETERWPIIKKLWTVYGPGRLEIYKGNHTNPKMIEMIVPRAP